MTDTASMRARVPAQSLLEELLRRQTSAPPLSRMARFFGRSPLAEGSLPWYLGAEGEMTVGAILAHLPQDWATFHALPIGKDSADIDHLVVGPGGIFTINTNHLAGKRISVGKHSMRVGDEDMPHLSNAEFEASRVTLLLRERMPLLPPVQPVIALVEPKQISIDGKPDKVKVIDARQLPRWLSGLSVVLAEPELDEVVDILDDPSTWRPAEQAEESPDGDELNRRFAELRSQVRAARTRRMAWLAAGGTALVISAIIVLPQLLQAGLPLAG